MDLPKRTREAEEAFVVRMLDSDPEILLDVVEELMAQRRPQLAARLVQLLPDQVEIEVGSAVDRAVKAAGLLLSRRLTPEDQSWSELEELLRETRRDRLDRVRRRQRESMYGTSSDMLGLTGHRPSRRRR